MILQESIYDVTRAEIDYARYINEFKHSIYNCGTNLLVCENRGKKRIKVGLFPITEDILEMKKTSVSFN